MSCEVAALPFQAYANYGQYTLVNAYDGWSIYNSLIVYSKLGQYFY